MKTKQLSSAIGIICAGLSMTSAGSEKVFFPQNGHSYQRIDTRMTWHQALDKCASLGKYLATVTSQAENQLIYKNFAARFQQPIWLGGTDNSPYHQHSQEGVWEWTTGEKWGYTHWRPGEPNNWGNGEHYLEMRYEFGERSWNDVRLAFNYPVCEWTNLLPVANFTVNPSSGHALLKVTLNASASNDPDGTITQYRWVSSGGQSATGRIATLTFNTAGTYNITLTVTDDSGTTSQKTTKISVLPQEFTLTATKDGLGTGTVSSAPAGIDCGSDCTEDYISGTTVALTATPNAGSLFTGWHGNCSGKANSITVTMDAAKTCTAFFKALICQIYAVQDSGLNDTQFFTVNPDTLAVKALGDSYPGYDIEALDAHPDTDALYAASGDDTDNPGHLYTVNTQTGALNDMGSTGFAEIEGLTFRADGTLWAWAKGDGLISIDPQNGPDGTLVFSSKLKVEDLTWNNDGTLLYAAQDTNLWVSDGQNVEKACDLRGHTEALEMLPDNRLLLGVHGNKNILEFEVMDLATCELVQGVGIPTDYDDVEGIAWAAKACAK